MAQVRIIFDGSMAIGPTFPPDFRTFGPLFAVLPHAPRQRSRRSKGGTPEYIPAHAPGIFTNITPSDGSREPDLKYEGYSIWYTLRERMEIAIDGSTDPGYLDYERELNFSPECINLTETHDIRAIADMREIWPARRRLKPGMLAAGPNVSPAVSTQVFIPGGTVSSSSEYDRYIANPIDRYNVCAKFDPKKTPDAVEKRLLPQVVVTIQFSRTLDILPFSLETGEDLDAIRFELRDLGPGGGDIWIVNGDLANYKYVIDKLSHPQPYVRPSSAVLGSDPAVDFELIYGLLGGPDFDGLPIPYLVPLGQRPCYTGLVDSGEGY
jgi:hypothetical protein